MKSSLHALNPEKKQEALELIEIEAIKTPIVSHHNGPMHWLGAGRPQKHRAGAKQSKKTGSKFALFVRHLLLVFGSSDQL